MQAKTVQQVRRIGRYVQSAEARMNALLAENIQEITAALRDALGEREIELEFLVLHDGALWSAFVSAKEIRLNLPGYDESGWSDVEWEKVSPGMIASILMDPSTNGML